MVKAAARISLMQLVMRILDSRVAALVGVVESICGR
jgi:hypothetical protein